METYYSLSFLLILDGVLAYVLLRNFVKLRFEFLQYAGAAFVFELLRQIFNISISAHTNPLIPIVLGGACIVSRGAFILQAAASLTDLRLRWTHHLPIVGTYVVLTIITLRTSFPAQVDWILVSSPVIFQHIAAAGVVALRTNKYTQGRIALSITLAMSALFLTLIAILAAQAGVLFGLYYLADSLSFLLSGIVFVLVAFESVQNDLLAAQRQTLDSQERYRQVFDSAFDAIVTLDKKGRITDFNPRAEVIFGIDAARMRGKPFARALIDESDRASVKESIASAARGESTGAWSTLDVLAEHHKGHSFPIELIVRPARIGTSNGVTLFARDLSRQRADEEERRKFDAQLQHTQKLESLGVLAGGIAHDFNNFLAGIMGFAGLAREALPDDSPARDDVREIEQIAARAADLTNQLLAYSGRGALVQRPIQLSALVREMETLLRSTASREAELVFELERNLRLVKADPSQLSQIVINLVTNASEAIGENAGTIRIRTGEAEFTPQKSEGTFANGFISPGPAVFLEVSDTGCGMDSTTRDRVFDPFFSTKFTGRGLGMAAVGGIVRRHRGAIAVESTPGKGSSFRAYFPVHKEAESIAYVTPPDPEMLTGATDWFQDGVALVVDDDPSVLALARQVLERRGFSVIPARDGQEGIDRFRENAANLTLVILDLTMPKMDGVQALEAMRRIRDDVPVILSSGYNEQSAGTLDPSIPFIQKPYRASALVQKVREVLGRT